MLLLTLRDIQYRASRTAIVVASTSLVFALVLLMTGLSAQFGREPRDTVATLGDANWVLAPGSTGAFTSAATLPDGTIESMGTVGPDLGPLAYGRYVLAAEEGPLDIVVIGFVPGALGTPRDVTGSDHPGAGQAIVAEAAGVEVGDTVTLGDREFAVVGTVPSATLFAGMPVVLLELSEAQAVLFGGRGAVSAALISRDVQAPDGLAVLPSELVAEDALRPLDGAIGSVNLIRALLWLVAAMLIGAVVYLAALERTRDVAVLAAVGVATRTVAASLALTALVIALASSAIATLLYRVLEPVFPLPVHVEPSALVQLPVVAVVVAILASIAGVRRIARVDPALAFAGPGA